MPYRVFVTNQEAVNDLTDDELVNRQTLVIKDGASWDLDGKVVLVDGSEQALDQAQAIIEEHGGSVSDKAEEIKADIDDEQEGAAAGLGSIFG
ncbi:MAG: hypothetical protein R3185_03825 [Candidatus Thermoplasmatota archaeon]|nr:hypothetical protein [Candidatus Thermoplasmatota archaeon]